MRKSLKKTGDYICILDSQSFGNMAICTWDKKQIKWTFKNWWGVHDEDIDTNKLKIKKWTPRENGIMLGCPGCGKSMTTKWKR